LRRIFRSADAPQSERRGRGSTVIADGAMNPSGRGAEPEPKRRRPQIHANSLQDLPHCHFECFRGLATPLQHAQALGRCSVALGGRPKPQSEQAVPAQDGRGIVRKHARPSLNPSTVSGFQKYYS
jgi:hypothetical protein